MRLTSITLVVRGLACVVLCVVLTACNSNRTSPEPQGSAPAVPTPTSAVPGPAPGTRMTEEYVSQVGRSAYFWAWPLVNVYNRLVAFGQLPEPGLIGGIVPAAPPNQLSMLTDYVVPEERVVACPNQDVVYGFSVLDLGREPVVIQVPDFGDRFWVYQIVDQRTDSFADIGKMYGTKPGLYLLVGPDWKGQTPAGIQHIFRSSTNVGIVCLQVA